jgi:hypothetical protein
METVVDENTDRNSWRSKQDAPPAGHNTPKETADPGADTSWTFDPSAFISGFDDADGVTISKAHLAKFVDGIRTQGSRDVRLFAIDNAHARWRQSLSPLRFKLFSAICDWSKDEFDGKQPRCVLMSLGRIAATCGIDDMPTASRTVAELEQAGAVVALRWMAGKTRRVFVAPVCSPADRKRLSRATVRDASIEAELDRRSKDAEKKRDQRSRAVPRPSSTENVPGYSSRQSPDKSQDIGSMSPDKSQDCPLIEVTLVSTRLGAALKVGAASAEAASAAPATQADDPSPFVEDVQTVEVTTQTQHAPLPKKVAVPVPLANLPSMAHGLDLTGGSVATGEPTPQQIALVAKACSFEKFSEAQRLHAIDVLRKATAQWNDAEPNAKGRRQFGNSTRTWQTLQDWFVSNWLPRLRKELTEISASDAAAASEREWMKPFEKIATVKVGEAFVQITGAELNAIMREHGDVLSADEVRSALKQAVSLTGAENELAHLAADRRAFNVVDVEAWRGLIPLTDKSDDALRRFAVRCQNDLADASGTIARELHSAHAGQRPAPEHLEIPHASALAWAQWFSANQKRLAEMFGARVANANLFRLAIIGEQVFTLMTYEIYRLHQTLDWAGAFSNGASWWQAIAELKPYDCDAPDQTLADALRETADQPAVTQKAAPKFIHVH